MGQEKWSSLAVHLMRAILEKLLVPDSLQVSRTNQISSTCSSDWTVGGSWCPDHQCARHELDQKPQLCCCHRWSGTPVYSPILRCRDEGAVLSWNCYASVTANEEILMNPAHCARDIRSRMEGHCVLVDCGRTRSPGPFSWAISSHLSARLPSTRVSAKQRGPRCFEKK